MRDIYEGLQHKEELEEFVQDVARAMCATHGLSPDALYDIPAGMDDDGQYKVEQMPNWSRFEEESRAAIAYIFGLSVERIHDLLYKHDVLQQAEARIERLMNDDENGHADKNEAT